MDVVSLLTTVYASSQPDKALSDLKKCIDVHDYDDYLDIIILRYWKGTILPKKEHTALDLRVTELIAGLDVGEDMCGYASSVGDREMLMTLYDKGHYGEYDMANLAHGGYIDALYMMFINKYRMSSKYLRIDSIDYCYTETIDFLKENLENWIAGEFPPIVKPAKTKGDSKGKDEI